MATTSSPTAMNPPPPPPPPSAPPSSSESVVTTSISSPSPTLGTSEEAAPIVPPPPNPKYSIAELPPPEEKKKTESHSIQKENVSVPYSIPPWSEAPTLPFFLEVLKDGAIIDHLDVTKKGAYMFGRIDSCDFILEHPTISRFHAVLQYKGDDVAYLYDLGSTHGTSVNKKQVSKKEYIELGVGDVIRFGLSTRLYIFQGPEELMPQETDLLSIRYARDREASLRRAREDAAHADGVSWGMREDAVDEVEDECDEVTWQNYRGELTEKQQKTREKVLKRMEKIAHMKKEMAAIRAKDIAQGGLTQGQQTQIARNELRISQILEELESLEETLNDSIRESLGARSGKASRGKQRGLGEDEDEFLSDDDDFYDRTKKKPASKSIDTQAVETADSLLDKKEALLNEMEEKKRLLLEENKTLEPMGEQDTGDVLDAYMSGLSSQLVLDRTTQVEKDLSSLQTELDRIVYLLKIADPTGEAAKKRATTPKEKKSKESAATSSAIKKPKESKIEQKNISQPEKTDSGSVAKQVTPDVTEEASEASKSKEDVTNATENKTTYKIVKPQWLGAVEDRESKEAQPERRSDTTDVGDEFIDYNERQKILDTNSQSGKDPESDIESAAPGLILRKKKPAEVSEDQISNLSVSEPAGTDMDVENAVALLLKHKRGICTAEEEADLRSHGGRNQKPSKQDNKRTRRVLGPEKPAFLEPHPESDYETWVPPEGQSGDGRTSLNDRLGY